jgi:microsomal dipeptidase-like Zn-dependent dipeptidase
MPFFDFHCHPVMKSHLAPAGQEPSSWKNITVQLEILKSIRINISAAFADALDSQSSLMQLQQGQVNLIGFIVYSLENKLAEQLLSKSIIRNGNVLQLAPGKLRRNIQGDRFYAVCREELQKAVQDAVAPAGIQVPTGSRLKFIRSISEYDPGDLTTIHAILILEGSQNLLNSLDSATLQQDFITNLDDLSRDFRLFAINPCHFQQQPMANHAFAMQFMDDNSPFYPTGNGITAWGKEAIRELYRRGILIDIKHMGLQSRHDLYRLRMDENIEQPLICSHAGVTGISEMDRLNYIYHEAPIDEGPVWKIRHLKKWGHIHKTAYNLSSLGLYDEDILQVIQSGGLIGISLDQRIIGFPANEPVLYKAGIHPTDLEYISKQETRAFFGTADPTQLLPHNQDNEEVMDFDDADNQNNSDTADLHVLYFLNQIIHILYVVKTKATAITVTDAINSICIGSDMDGLINPLDCCGSVKDYASFKATLADVMRKRSFWRGSGFRLGELDTDRLLDKIFFENAQAFLQKHFQ